MIPNNINYNFNNYSISKYYKCPDNHIQIHNLPDTSSCRSYCHMLMDNYYNIIIMHSFENKRLITEVKLYKFKERGRKSFLFLAPLTTKKYTNQYIYDNYNMMKEIPTNIIIDVYNKNKCHHFKSTTHFNKEYDRYLEIHQQSYEYGKINKKTYDHYKLPSSFYNYYINNVF